MAQHLSKLLNAEEPMFSLMIQGLEVASGRTGVDVRLMSEVMQNAQRKLRELQLDPGDTTGKELYAALLDKATHNDESLRRQMKIGHNDSADALFGHVKHTLDNLDIPKKAWVLKKSVMRRLLKKYPPKAVMKQLGYKSVDSMIKREDILELSVAIRAVESELWLRRFTQQYSVLRASDFEERAISPVVMLDQKWGQSCGPFIRKKGHNVVHLKEMGVIGFAPVGAQQIPCLTLLTTLMALVYINEVRVYSTYLKLNQVKTDFADVLCNALLNDPADAASLVGQPIHWRIIHKHIGTHRNTAVDLFAPHVQAEDLLWHSAEETLSMIDPSFLWWHNLNYTGIVLDGKPVSFNCIDNTLSASHSLDYHHRYFAHFRASLWSELYSRYLGQPVLEQQIMQQLNTEIVAPETVAFATSEGIW